MAEGGVPRRDKMTKIGQALRDLSRVSVVNRRGGRLRLQKETQGMAAKRRQLGQGHVNFPLSDRRSVRLWLRPPGKQFHALLSVDKASSVATCDACRRYCLGLWVLRCGLGRRKSGDNALRRKEAEGSSLTEEGIGIGASPAR